MFFRNDCPKSVLLASLALFLAGCGDGGGGEPSTDADSDGFSDAEEMMAGSDPNNALSTPNDIDGDGLPDAWEDEHGITDPDGNADSDDFTNKQEHDAGSDPNNALSTPDDIDGDGFTNAAEMMAGSDPNLAASTPDDIDGDGLPDAWEDEHGITDPDGNADSDDFTNKQEHDAGSDPNNALSTPNDIDGDGLPDAWEDEHGITDPDGNADSDDFTNKQEHDAGSDPNNALSTPDDIDGDGFTNAAEIMAGSDPNNALSIPNDADGDGFSDVEEMMAGSDPNLAASTPNDIDGDGFTNAAEMTAGSDPNLAASTPNDIDGDGFTNAAEMMAGSNPNLAASTPDDIDGDGFTNAAEIMAGSDPNNALSTPNDIDGDGVANDMDEDRDGDGLLDSWEETYGLGYSSISDATGINGPDGDPDSDGFTNAAEMTAGSNPNLVASTPNDIDGDGFTNAAEMTAGSDPNLAASTPNDIDGDGLPDAWESMYGLDPNDNGDIDNGGTDVNNGPDGDLDSDGFTNAAEYIAGSDPNLATSTPDDIDGDGLPDAWESMYDDTGSGNLDPTGDPDSDGFTNAAEYMAGSYPNLAASTPNDIDGDGVANAADTNPRLFDRTQIGADDIDDTASVNAGNAGFTLSGAAASDELGRSVSGAGDVNGDGTDDVIVGARYNDAGGINAGAAYVIYGTDDGSHMDVNVGSLTASQGFRILGAATSDELGYSVSGAGDVNGDGIADVIVGARNNDDGTLSNTGAAYVIYGQTGNTRGDIDVGATTGEDATFPASAGFRILGAAAGDNLGNSVSGAGDVNGDGYDDLIVGARNNDEGGSNAGAAYVIYGQDSTVENYVDRGNIDVGDMTSFSASVGFTINGAATIDTLGDAVSGAGDVNGDGIDDLIVGANGVNSFAGAAYVIYGQDSTVENYVDRGDLNVGATTGEDATFPASAGFRLSGARSGDNLGFSVSGAGDVNGDGIDDLIVGAASNDVGGIDAGAAYVIYGQDSTVENYVDRGDLNALNLSASNGFRILGAAAADYLGASVSAAGDTNNDGIDDVIVGAYFNSDTNAGAAYVIYGQDSTVENYVDRGDLNVGATTGEDATFPASVGFTLTGAAGGDSLGYSVSSAGDVNGDGADDLIAGANGVQNAAGDTNTGAAYVLLSPTPVE